MRRPPRLRKIDGLLAIIGVWAALVATAVLVTRDDTPPAGAQNGTYTVTTAVSPEGCGTVIVQEVGDERVPDLASEWTFPRNVHVRATARPVSGCGFSHWVLDYGNNATIRVRENPNKYLLDTNITATAHFTGTPAATTPTPTPSPTPTTPTEPIVCTKAVLGDDPTTNTDLGRDCATLLGMKLALAGTATLNWGGGTAMSKWEGVTVSGTPRRVTGLNLREKSLTGTISTSIGNLTELTTLDLSKNKLTGTIPASVGKLTKLDHFHLGHNKLTGSIPTQLGKLTAVRFLALGFNQLTGPIPVELGKLAKVTSLWLRENKLTGSIPIELGNLVRLRELILHDNKLSGVIPVELGKLTKINKLRLDDNSLTGEIPLALGTLSKLKIVRVAGNSLTGCVPGQWADVADNDLAKVKLPYCGTTLEYDVFDPDGEAMEDGSYALLTDTDDLASGVTTHEYLTLEVKGIVVNVRDAEGASRATFYNSIRVGDVLEWNPTGQGQEMCWQRYRVTGIETDPSGSVGRKLFSLEGLTKFMRHCSGPVAAAGTLDVELLWNPPAARKVYEDGPLTMLIHQPVEGPLTVALSSFTNYTIDIPDGMTLVRFSPYVIGSSGSHPTALRDVKSGSLLYIDFHRGTEISRTVVTVEGDTRDIGALFDQIIASITEWDWD